MYYHELAAALREYLRERGVTTGIVDILAMLHCAVVDVTVETKGKQDEPKADPTT